MAIALTLADRGLGNTWPNPAVGCVIVRDGRIEGRGRTAPGGRPHAETQALAQAGERARGATAYVSLEPCAHQGKTPPCTDALIAAGVSRVVSATTDSDPRVAGRGLAALKAAGIEVTSGILQSRARQLNAGFFTRVEQGRPMLTLKLASSFDGRIATATGESQWITGPGARRVVHALRARHDAVMIGAGTARDDDPSLTVRDLGIGQQPVRIVLSRTLNIPLSGSLARTAADVPLWLVHGGEAPSARVNSWLETGAKLISLSGQKGALNVQDALAQLGALGLTRIFCEGGGSLAASLLSVDVVDRLIGFSAGKFIGAEGHPSVGALGLGRLADAPEFHLQSVQRIGGDVMHEWTRSAR